MRVGVVKEIKPAEWRVALTPAGTAELVGGGNTVLVEKGAGEGSGFKDSAYVDAGALVVDDPAKIWADVDLLVKVKEPIEPEFPFLHEGLILFTYLHLAADPALTAALVRSGTTGVAYETVEDSQWPPAAAGPHERDRRPSRRSGRGPLLDHAHGRSRHIGRGSPRCGPGEGACPRRGSSRRLCRPRCSWSGGGCHRSWNGPTSASGTSTNGSRGLSAR